MRHLSNKVKAEVVIPFSSLSSIRAIRKALAVDEKHPPNANASVKFAIQKRKLLLYIQAKDISTLRAVLNSHLRLLLAWRRITDFLA